MSPLPLAAEIWLACMVIAAAILDIRTRKIPNWLTLSGVVIAIALYTFLFETQGLVFSLQGLGLAFGIYFVLYLLRGMGAGDVKLMAAVGAATGWKNWLAILVLTSAAGALAAIVVIALKGRFHKTLHNISVILLSLRHGQAPYKVSPELDIRSEKALRLPHAVVIAIGTLSFLIVIRILARHP